MQLVIYNKTAKNKCSRSFQVMSIVFKAWTPCMSHSQAHMLQLSKYLRLTAVQNLHRLNYS